MAAWHAAQMLRERMLNVAQLEEYGIFHYQWCLYVGKLTIWAFHHFGAQVALTPRSLCNHTGPEAEAEVHAWSRKKMNILVASMASIAPANMERLIGKCCTQGLTTEMASYLRTVRWTAAYEATKILKELSMQDCA